MEYSNQQTLMEEVDAKEAYQVLAELVQQFDQAGFGERLAKAEELVAKLRHYLS